MLPNIIEVENVSKSFRVGAQTVPVLKDISFTVRQGDFMIIFGPSGCGKSTLLHTILGLEPPTAGRVVFLGHDLWGAIEPGTLNAEHRGERQAQSSRFKVPGSKLHVSRSRFHVPGSKFSVPSSLFQVPSSRFQVPSSKFQVLCSEDERSEFRKRQVGMVFQQPNWVRSLTVLENVAFPLLLLGEGKSQSLEKAKKMLETVEMLAWQDYLPAELSSGQQQKVALARALISNPQVLIADEPTGNLDYDSGRELMALLTSLNKEKGKTIIMVTHDLTYLGFAATVVKMLDGRVVDIYGEKDKERLMKNLGRETCNL